MTLETTSKMLGILGEKLAFSFLSQKGYKVLLKNYEISLGEIDLIARDGASLVFIEVKTRKKDADLSLAIDHPRLRRVAAAADLLYPRYAKGAENVRIDVILVAPWQLPHHLVNVWHG